MLGCRATPPMGARAALWSTGRVPISDADVGGRVVVRHRLPDGRATDVLGELVALDGERLAVRRAGGERVEVAVADVVAARPVPPAPARRAGRAPG